MFNPDDFMARLAGPPLLMGILNVTPDSFSDGGCFNDPEAAAAQAARMVADGADILDIGGESTRPGHAPIDAATEIDRIRPALAAAARLATPVSIDSYKAETVRMALAGGANIVNDVWGLQRDPELAQVAADADAPVICNHNRETTEPDIDIVDDVLRFLERSLEIARKAGIAENRIILDPGFGFGKTFDQSLELLRRLDAVASLGFPLLIGLSRKGFIGHYSRQADVRARLPGTLAANLLAALSGHAAIIRVHDVRPHREMLDMLSAFGGRAAD